MVPSRIMLKFKGSVFFPKSGFLIVLLGIKIRGIIFRIPIFIEECSPTRNPRYRLDYVLLLLTNSLFSDIGDVECGRAKPGHR